ncbi:MAG TPA: TonB-dependent receptor [Acidobacteriaceae bacterium]|nr:TonB-dependent receptor [Acidobacteriaceae bacterium]
MFSKFAAVLCLLAAIVCLMAAPPAHASVFGSVKGIVHDPSHRPIEGATITLHAAHSAYVVTAHSNSDGEFSFVSVPLGDYIITVSANGFTTMRQPLAVISNASSYLHFPLPVATVEQSTHVSAQQQVVNPDTVTPTTMISREAIARTPGADRTNSLAMITDYVPGAYMTHDMLHMRGGHQLSWLIDGIALPNTNIGSNIGPQIDPKDVDYVEANRGSYNASLGDRTYGIFDVVPRSGFEYNRQGTLVLSVGNLYQTNDQVSLGNHTEKFAWYLSANGNRSNYGLQPPAAKPVHDAENGYGGFASFIYNHDDHNQLRFDTQLRSDYYQIPYDPNPNDWQNQIYDSSGLRDAQRETDAYGIFSWVHTFNSSTLLQVSPFYHFNQAKYEPSPQDQPAATTSYQTGNYAGLQSSISTTIAKNSIRAGIYGYGQHEGDRFGAVFNDGSYQNFSQNSTVAAGVEETYAEDQYKPTTWLTLTAGERQSHFQGAISEDAVYPRLGAAVLIPKLGWVFRGFYGHFYQPPPLTSLSGPGLAYANGANTTFVPLRGERDEEHQFGVEIPLHGWVFSADTFETRANNFLDHSNIGESSVFIPVTVQGALVQAWEATLRSPLLWRYGQFHLAYSNQIAQQRGPVTGGLVCYSPGDPSACAVAPGYSALDHDQRNTLNVGMNSNLPRHVYAAFNIYYGSGFSNGFTDPPSPYSGNYLPGHTTADISLGKTFSDKFSLDVNALNVANTRVLLDNSLTFGGFHYNDPRQIYAELRYRFHF